MNSVDLSKRQREVLKMIISGYTTGEIASQLYLSAETVKSHRSTLLRKFNVKNSVGLVRKAFEMQITGKVTV